MNQFIIKVLVESEKPVYRDLMVSENIDLLQLHHAIKDAFGFKGNELASFSHENELLGAEIEIPLENLGDEDISLMKDVHISEIIKEEGDQLNYTYDFASDWQFFIELIEIKKSPSDTEKDIVLLKKYGEAPDENSKKITGEDAESILMNAILGEELSDDEFNDPFSSDDMDSIDDYEDYY